MIFTLPSRSSEILQILKDKGNRCISSNLDIKMSNLSFHMFSFIILLIIEWPEAIQNDTLRLPLVFFSFCLSGRLIAQTLWYIFKSKRLVSFYYDCFQKIQNTILSKCINHKLLKLWAVDLAIVRIFEHQLSSVSKTLHLQLCYVFVVAFYQLFMWIFIFIHDKHTFFVIFVVVYFETFLLYLVQYFAYLDILHTFILTYTLYLQDAEEKSHNLDLLK